MNKRGQQGVRVNFKLTDYTPPRSREMPRLRPYAATSTFMFRYAWRSASGTFQWLQFFFIELRF
jgi:hypothetical protein